MTTAAEVRQIAASHATVAQRVVLQPSSLLASPEGLAAVAREIVALANRDGGRVVFGIDASGRFEGPLGMSPDTVRELVDGLVSKRIVPALHVSTEHLADPEGELLVLRVPRRAGPPHGLARSSAAGDAAAAAYYVRDGNRTRSVTDEQLAWMRRVTSDPAVRASHLLLVQTPEGSVRPASSVAQAPACGRLAALLERLPASEDARLAGAATRPRAYVELAGWVFLAQVSEAVASAADALSAETVSLDNLNVPVAGSVFASLPGGLRGLLGGSPSPAGLRRLLARRRAAPGFCVPAGSDVQIDLLPRQQKARTTITHPDMVITFTATADLPGAAPGSPAGAPSRDEPWALVCVRVEMACSLVFPAAAPGGGRGAGPLASGVTAGEVLVDRLQRELAAVWGGDRLGS